MFHQMYFSSRGKRDRRSEEGIQLFFYIIFILIIFWLLFKTTETISEILPNSSTIPKESETVQITKVEEGDDTTFKIKGEAEFADGENVARSKRTQRNAAHTSSFSYTSNSFMHREDNQPIIL